MTQTIAHPATVARDDHYNFGYLDESTKRMLRRALLKAVAIPGYQVPFGSREMPLPYGWGTGGVQVTAAIIGKRDVLKVIDQGSDDTTNAVNIRRFFGRADRRADHRAHRRASIIQTRHRIPEAALRARPGHGLPGAHSRAAALAASRRETETRTMHALSEYGAMHVKLYEDIAHLGAYRHDLRLPGDGQPALPDLRPSPIPKFDNPKLDMQPALMLFGAGREKRIYAVPPYTAVRQPRFRGPPVRGAEVVELLRPVRRHATAFSTK